MRRERQDSLEQRESLWHGSAGEQGSAVGPRVPDGVAGDALGVAVTSSARGWIGRSGFPISASDSTSVYLRLIGTLERVRSSRCPVSYCRASLKR